MQIEKGIARILDKDSRMVRFYAARMLLELTMRRPLTPEEQHRVYFQCGKKLFMEMGES